MLGLYKLKLDQHKVYHKENSSQSHQSRFSLIQSSIKPDFSQPYKNKNKQGIKNKKRNNEIFPS